MVSTVVVGLPAALTVVVCLVDFGYVIDEIRVGVERLVAFRTGIAWLQTVGDVGEEVMGC